MMRSVPQFTVTLAIERNGLVRRCRWKLIWQHRSVYLACC